MASLDEFCFKSRIHQILAIGIGSALMVIGGGCSKSAAKARHIEKAESYFQKGEWENAEVEYLNALRLDAENTAVIRRLGAMYDDQGRVRVAFHLLTKAKQLASDDLESRVRLAGLLNTTGQPGKAREDLRLILDARPDLAEAVILLAETALTPTEIKETRDTLQKLRQRAGDQAIYDVADGIVFLRQTNAVAAEKAFNQARSKNPKLPSVYPGLGAVYWQNKDLLQAERMFKTAVDLSPARSRALLLWTNFKIENGGAVEAQSYLEEFVRKTPDFIPALNRLAELQFAAGKTNECTARVTKVLSMDPENYEARALLGRLKMAGGQFAEAVQELERLKSLYPKLPLAHYQLARAYLANREASKAVVSLETAVSLNPNALEPALLLADLSMRRGDPLRAVTLLSDIVKKRPQNEQAFFLLANAHRTRGNLDVAMQIYERLAKDHPTNPAASLSIGSILREQGKLGDARKRFETALQIVPGSTAAMSELVELDLAEKNIPAALQRIEGALTRNPRSAELHFLHAKVLIAKGDTTQAEKALRETLALAPDLQAAYAALAQLYIQAKKPEAALAELNGILAKNPSDTGTLLVMGMLLESQGDYIRSKDTYEKLLAVDPKSSTALNNLAYVYGVRLNQPEKGFERAQKAREQRPDDPYIADTFGWLTYLRGDYARALSVLRESAAKLADPEAQYHAGMAHYMMGEEEPARVALTKAAQSSADFPGKAEARQKLLLLDSSSALPAADTMQRLSQSLAQSPKDVVILLRLASLHAQSGSLDKALDLAERALKISPQAARTLLLLAQYNQRKPDGAQRALEYAKSARAAAPQDTEVAHSAARTAFQAGWHDWAYSTLLDTRWQQSDNPELAYDFAWSAYGVGRVSDAESAMQTALRSGTNFSRAESARQFLEFTALLREPARLELAAQRIQDALKSDPGYVPALMASALARKQQNDALEASKLYEQVLGRWPQFLPAIRNLTLLYAGPLNEPQKAFELGTKARRASTEDAELAGALGKLAYNRGDFQLAGQWLKEAREKNAASAETYFYLGLSQVQLKQTADGAANLRQALAMNLDAKLADEARRILAEAK